MASSRIKNSPPTPDASINPRAAPPGAGANDAPAAPARSGEPSASARRDQAPKQRFAQAGQATKLEYRLAKALCAEDGRRTDLLRRLRSDIRPLFSNPKLYEWAAGAMAVIEEALFADAAGFWAKPVKGAVKLSQAFESSFAALQALTCERALELRDAAQRRNGHPGARRDTAEEARVRAQARQARTFFEHHPVPALDDATVQELQVFALAEQTAPPTE